ncbi:hypothetical protein BKA62DRAFT_688425 [Auriculariales sp. MPI-PUGE-AT-0066]|nr:hypothetical protein BKA62DRAFT_688425 [Auriculariales sp. MPI-PUGE-AT-0066]
MDVKSAAGPSSLQHVADQLPAYSEQAPIVKPLYTCMTLNKTDTLRLINCPPPTVSAIRDVILARWPKGLQKEKEYHGALEFQLRGLPWVDQGSNSVPARQLMLSILATFYQLGWTLVASTDITKKQEDKDSLFFRTGHSLPPKAQFFAISFNEGDKLRLIEAPAEIIKAVQGLLVDKTQKAEWKVDNVVYQFKVWVSSTRSLASLSHARHKS